MRLLRRDLECEVSESQDLPYQRQEGFKKSLWKKIKTKTKKNPAIYNTSFLMRMGQRSRHRK